MVHCIIESFLIEQVLQLLGAELTDNPKECTHLVAERISRTVKFLSVMSHGAMIVTPRWVADSVAQRKLLRNEFVSLKYVFFLLLYF